MVSVVPINQKKKNLITKIWKKKIRIYHPETINLDNLELGHHENKETRKLGIRVKNVVFGNWKLDQIGNI